MQTDGLMALAERYENDSEQSERLENLFQVIEENPDMMDLPLKEVDDPLLAEILEALRKPRQKSPVFKHGKFKSTQCYGD